MVAIPFLPPFLFPAAGERGSPEEAIGKAGSAAGDENLGNPKEVFGKAGSAAAETAFRPSVFYAEMERAASTGKCDLVFFQPKVYLDQVGQQLGFGHQLPEPRAVVLRLFPDQF